MNKTSITVIAIVIILAFLTACEKSAETKKADSGNEDPADYTWDTSTVVKIVMSGIAISVIPAVAEVNGNVVTITSAGTYDLSGSLTDGQVVVDTKDDGNVRLIFNGISIKCTTSAPVYVVRAKKVIVILQEGSVNTLTDGTSYAQTNGEPDAAIFSNSYLSFSGDGSLSVTANFKDGISSDDGLVINSGTITVKSADDGIRGKDYLVVRKGNLTINSAGDGLKSTNDEDTSLGYVEIESGSFNITAAAGDAISAVTSLAITDGVFSITTGGGASSVSSGTGTSAGNPGGGPGGGPGGTSGGYAGTISEKGLKGKAALTITRGTFSINSADDALHSNSAISINGGTFEIASGDDAIHADASVVIEGGTIEVTRSYEAIESACITLNGGDVSLVSTDDGFNATMGEATEANDGSILNLNGGNITVNSSSGDAIDSNGNVAMTGGTVIAHGPTSAPEVGIDVNGTFKVTGGILIATGPNSGNMIESISESSSQYAVKTTISSTLAPASLFHIEDSEGNDVITYKPVRTIYYIIISKPELREGGTYSTWTGGTTTGTNINGVCSGGTYSGGTLKKTFTISGELTNVSF